MQHAIEHCSTSALTNLFCVGFSFFAAFVFLSPSLLCVSLPLQPIVFLDEPSTGMDPLSRRFMWNFISETMSNRAVILTTHSMEECEALCHRIGIIRAGVLQCIGTSQHLKNRYGSGYRVEVRVPAMHQSAARKWLAQQFPGCREVEVTDTRIKIQTVTTATSPAGVAGAAASAQQQQPGGQSLAQIFRAVEGARADLHLTDYAVGQTSLEDIFLTLAGHGAQA